MRITGGHVNREFTRGERHTKSEEMFKKQV